MEVQIIEYHRQLWGRQGTRTEIHPYALIQLRPGALPPIIAWREQICWAHATTEGGMKGILKDKEVKPTGNFYEAQKKPFEAFMCVACKTSGTDADFNEIARTIRKALQHGKNRCNLIAVGIAQGKCTALDQGGS